MRSSGAVSADDLLLVAKFPTIPLIFSINLDAAASG
jgi:hypothetical protein